ncbi:MAG TPA: phosphoribosylamine--glycine ligase [Candidatus Eisenbacteria bacterium]|nr:phosphoribosylamine--glycine ligase [Candidatus Eisenbacteria bacterium]
MPASVAPRRILVVGSGGREHAIAWRLARDPEPAELIAAPGNDGLASLARCVPVAADDVPALVALARGERVDLVVAGPELPLARGLADACTAAGIPVFGPVRAAAELETSKQFAKERMRALGIPTPRAETCATLAEAEAALARSDAPWVVKVDGLAAGKGVRVSDSRAEVREFLADALERGRFGDAGRRVLVEEFVAGEELSVMAVTDGERCVLLPPARDAKRARDGDRGPNTGGMGAYAPAVDDAALEATVAERIVQPLLADMRARGTPFRGVLYAGLVLSATGPTVLEFNVRFGDPEAEAVLPLVTGEFGALLAGAARGALDPRAIARAPGAAIAVALVDERYPEDGAGGVIEGLEALAAGDAIVFIGSARRQAAAWRFAGGRVAWVGARGADVTEARARAYAGIDRLGGEGWRCRRDIGGAAASGSAARAHAAAAEEGI